MPQDGFGPDGKVSLLGKIMLLVLDLNVKLRAAAMAGECVVLDSAERTDPITGGTYTELLVCGSTDEPERATDL